MPARKNSKKEKYILVCPQCKSTEVYHDTSTHMQAAGAPAMYACSECGHTGYAFPEVAKSKLRSFRKKKGTVKKEEKHELVDTSYGKFQVNFWWKIMGPLTILAGIYLISIPQIGVILILLGAFMTYSAFKKKA